jgi:hypothetical protein
MMRRQHSNLMNTTIAVNGTGRHDGVLKRARGIDFEYWMARVSDKFDMAWGHKFPSFTFASPTHESSQVTPMHPEARHEQQS